MVRFTTRSCLRGEGAPSEFAVVRARLWPSGVVAKEAKAATERKLRRFMSRDIYLLRLHQGLRG
jgi:hypothetical protein